MTQPRSTQPLSFPEHIPDHELDGTQPLQAVDPSKHLPPPPSQPPRVPSNDRGERRTPPPLTPDKPKRGTLVPAETRLPQPGYVPLDVVPRDARKQKPQRSGCFLPAWSILLTLILVFACAAAMLAAVIALGGDADPGGAPQIVVLTAMQTPTSPLDALLITPTPTLQIIPEVGDQFFDLQGPTLAAVIFTATPVGIAVGVTVTVDVDGGLNVRPQPSTDNQELFRANFGELFIVVEGPQNNQGLTWWRIEDLTNRARGGWAAGEFLQVVPQ